MERPAAVAREFGAILDWFELVLGQYDTQNLPKWPAASS